MTGAELAARFLQLAQTASPPAAGPEDVLATLYGLDEVTVTVEGHQTAVTIPEMGLLTVVGVLDVGNAEWYATVPTDTGTTGYGFLAGRGDPFKPGADNHLPTKAGHVMAVPYRVMAATMKTTNRAERRALKNVRGR